MATNTEPKRLRKELKLFDVFAISTGAMFSSGFFLLPGLAAAQTGASVILAYLLAGILILPAMFSMAELSTAMPRAGGAYYFLDRSLGPLFGTVGGLGTYLALTLKTAFALVGIGAYAALFIELPIKPVAIVLTLVFMVLNIMGAKETTGLQRVLVSILILVLAFFSLLGLYEIINLSETGIARERLSPFMTYGIGGLLSTVGFVFVSYAGLTKVASVAEEVENPERNLPLGMILSLVVTSFIYVLGVYIMVEVLDPETFYADLTPVATTMANFSAGLPDPFGVILIVIAAVAAFSSTGNAGLLSASRYPLAMGRDKLIPRQLASLSERFHTPMISIIITSVLVIAIILLLDEEGIAKLASAFQLFIFVLINIAVIVMRESHIASYDPGYRSPFYPWMQFFGVVTAIALILYMGPQAIIFTVGTTMLCIVWYFYYVRSRVQRHGAIYHWFARLGQRQNQELDYELWQIMREKGLRENDPFDELVTHATVLDYQDKAVSFSELVHEVSAILAPRLSATTAELSNGFLQETRIGWVPTSHGVCLPSLLLFRLQTPQLVLVRSERGIAVNVTDVHGQHGSDNLIHAFCFLVSPEEDPKLHLRLLAEIAERIDDADFLEQWLAAGDENELRETLLLDENFLSLRLDPDTPASALIGRALRDITLPTDTLVAIIHRDQQTIIPRGDTIFRAHDRVIIIGDAPGIHQLHHEFVGGHPWLHNE